MSWHETLLQAVKLRPRHLLGLGFVCLVVVVMPRPWREYLGYEAVTQAYRGWISLAGLVLMAYGVVMAAADTWPSVMRWYNGWWFKGKAPDVLAKLSRQEKEYVAKYLAQDASSLNFCLGDGIVNGLVQKRVVTRVSNVSVEDDEFAFNLEPWVIETLKRHPRLQDDFKPYVLKEKDRWMDAY